MKFTYKQHIAIVGLAFLLLSILPAQSQVKNSFDFTFQTDTISAACSDPVYRQFDYWIGEWSVKNPTGDVIGQSKISRVSDGCAILEEWSGSSGVTGRSLNFYDRNLGQWRQTWVGGGGMILDLKGNLENGNMSLYTTKETEDGPVKHRIRWTTLADGRIEQRWDTSTDGGKSWKQTFLGLYEKEG